MGRIFGLGKNSLAQYMRNNGLQAPADLQIKFRAQSVAAAYAKAAETKYKNIDPYILANYLTMPLKVIGENLGGRSGRFIVDRLAAHNLKVPPEVTEQHKINVRFKKGSTPKNKGKKMSVEQYAIASKSFFKKGQRSTNYQRIGSIHIRQSHKRRNGGKPYKWKKIGKDKWRELHILVWEKANNKKVPTGYCIWFKDKNTLNVKIGNLELITRAENLKRNRADYLQLPPELKKTKTLLKKLKKKIYGKEQTNRS